MNVLKKQNNKLLLFFLLKKIVSDLLAGILEIINEI